MSFKRVEPINLSEQSVKDNTSAFDTDFLGMNRKTFLLDKMWKAQSFDLSKKKIFPNISI